MGKKIKALKDGEFRTVHVLSVEEMGERLGASVNVIVDALKYSLTALYILVGPKTFADILGYLLDALDKNKEIAYENVETANAMARESDD